MVCTGVCISLSVAVPLGLVKSIRRTAAAQVLPLPKRESEESCAQSKRGEVNTVLDLFIRDLICTQYMAFVPLFSLPCLTASVPGATRLSRSQCLLLRLW